MANSYFQFKQFVVHQSKAAMKVGTDGVLLGAWADVEGCTTILDVGTGTGLIALMLAQRNAAAKIAAIDIDEGAVLQAKDNFGLSDWKERLQVKHSTLQAFVRDSNTMYDHVVCNPPFFNKAYKSDNHSRNLARHTESLSYLELIRNAYRVSHPRGKLSVVLPFDVEEEFKKMAIEEGFCPHRITRIKPTPQKSYVRVLIELSKQQIEQAEIDEMIIEDKGRHGYSDDYIALTKAYYLNM
ncbi:tRNA1(Val) (adenine(37)-N6)-methyltransferase [Carboxylicivirga litoralis]|uniref:tRNA1(Val) (adenine(37)-N6)-methyltransferase n=1 Tax=Carboxylicivirga litoralis TaxID=2816963 RepID=UPI0021CAE5BB|nr:methyltransferase [Carboxylicivirga sp. A043]